MTTKRETVKVALAQINSTAGEKSYNLKLFEKASVKASKKGADLIIFPELSLTGYVVRDQIYELAETVPGPSVDLVEKIASRLNLHIIFGMPELSEKTQATLYNAAVLVGPKGYIGKYRKMHLPTHSVFEEKRYFRPGYETAAYETSVGRIGLTICYDIYFPEITRLARLKGAELIVCISASPAVRRTFFEILTTARAVENASFLAFVNLTGIENGLQFWGGSRLLGPQGKILAKAKYDEEDFVIGELDYSDIKPYETFVPVLKDLRPELYEDLKESAKRL